MNTLSHLRKTGLLAGALAILSAPLSAAKESTRLVALRLPAEEVAAVRAELNAPEKSGKPETMAAVLKRRGVALVADLQQENPWQEERVELEKTTGTLESAGDVLDLGVKLKLWSHRREGGVDARLQAEILLPTGGKGIRQLDGSGEMRLTEPGRWREWLCWGDGKEAVMLWEYPLGFSAGAKPEDDGRVPVRVEMKWFKAGEADLARLEKSKPETREKALEWLEGRARGWKEAVYSFRLGNPSIWAVSEGKHEVEDDLMMAEDGLTIETKGVAVEGSIKLDWDVKARERSKEKDSHLSATLEPGIWEFLPVEGVAGANLVACRIKMP
ncbi:MAG: hypothetical protein RLZ97_410 [Verrucomicrobiota bacterium]|jgi:hypothetical protein